MIFGTYGIDKPWYCNEAYLEIENLHGKGIYQPFDLFGYTSY